MAEYARNELLRALDLRLTALKEEILVVLNKAVGSNLSIKELSDLSTFVQQFGPSEFRYVAEAFYFILKNHSIIHSNIINRAGRSQVACFLFIPFSPLVFIIISLFREA